MRHGPAVGPFVTILAFLGAAALAADGADSPGDRSCGPDPDLLLGIWRLEPCEGMWTHLEVYRRDDRYCARILCLSDPCYPPDDARGMGGRPRLDRNNCRQELRQRPLVGLEVLHSLRYDQEGRWRDGRAYSPDRGKEAHCKIDLVDRNTLDCYVYGKIGFIKVGKNLTWTRVAGPAPASAAEPARHASLTVGNLSAAPLP